MPKDKTKNPTKQRIANPTVRNVCFTINNPTTDVYQNLQNQLDGVSGCIWQLEKCPSSGTLHIQGYLELSKPKRFSGIKKLLGCNSAHLEPRKSKTPGPAIDYCRKEESRCTSSDCDSKLYPGGAGPFQWGELSSDGNQGNRNDLAEACETLREEGYSAVAEKHPTSFVKYFRGFKALETAIIKPYKGKIKKIAIIGPTGCGKTWKATHDYGEAFVWSINSSGNCFWDGYNGEETIVIDDFRGPSSGISLDFFLKLCNDDALLTQLNVKGVTTVNRAKTIVVTSPLEPKDWFPQASNLLDNVTAQVTRRFPEVIRLKDPYVPPKDPKPMEVIEISDDEEMAPKQDYFEDCDSIDIDDLEEDL